MKKKEINKCITYYYKQYGKDRTFKIGDWFCTFSELTNSDISFLPVDLNHKVSTIKKLNLLTTNSEVLSTRFHNINLGSIFFTHYTPLIVNSRSVSIEGLDGRTFRGIRKGLYHDLLLNYQRLMFQKDLDKVLDKKEVIEKKRGKI